MKKILVINCKGEKCGVYQYGYRFYQAIKDLTEYSVVYNECSNEGEILQSVRIEKPELVVYNYYFGRTPYITKEVLHQMVGTLHICLAHELSDDEIHRIDGSFFHFYLFGHPFLKHKSPHLFKIGRLIPPYNNIKTKPTLPTIGSFGFGSRIKGYGPLIDLVQKEFDEAVINLHIPANEYFDPQGKDAKTLARQLEEKITKKGIKLNVTHEFLSEVQLLDFLAENTINVFMYDPREFSSANGLSSAIDFAIAARRPLAVTKCGLFRHLFHLEPSIVLRFNIPMKERINAWYLRLKASVKRLLGKEVDQEVRKREKAVRRYQSGIEYTKLKKIIKNGTQPLEFIYEDWTIEKFRLNFVQIIKKMTEQSFQSSNILYPILDEQSQEKLVMETKGAEK
jgi:hypothetical protein